MPVPLSTEPAHTRATRSQMRGSWLGVTLHLPWPGPVPCRGRREPRRTGGCTGQACHWQRPGPAPCGCSEGCLPRPVDARWEGCGESSRKVKITLFLRDGGQSCMHIAGGQFSLLASAQQGDPNKQGWAPVTGPWIPGHPNSAAGPLWGLCV